MPDHETLQRVGRQNLRHVMDNNCTDPDCELHHPEVGIEEETVGLTDLAFYLAGYYAGVEYTVSELDGLTDNMVDELVNRGLINRKEVYPDADDPQTP